MNIFSIRRFSILFQQILKSRIITFLAGIASFRIFKQSFNIILNKYYDSGADAIIFIFFPFCDPQYLAHATIKKKLKDVGIRSLILEAGIGKSNFAQIQTRIEALLESL